MIKCIAADMDGTLLNSMTKKITSENRQAILDAQSEGIEVVIATGRAYDELNYLLEDSGLQCPLILVNGAETRTKEGKIIATNPLNKQQAEDAAKILAESGVYFEVYTDKGKFTKDREKSISVILNIMKSANPNVNIGETTAFVRERAAKIKLTSDYETLFNDQVYKYLAFSFDAENLANAAKKLEGLENIAVSSSGNGNIEITHRLAQKGVALEGFVNERKIALADTMAIGDNYNDVSMFERVGRSVAMGNADAIIKAKCDFTTATNDENGVAKAIWEVLKARQ